MNFVNMRMRAYISLAKVMASPEMKETDRNAILLLSENAMQGNNAEEYINRLLNMRRQNEDLKQVGKAIADQFSRDNNQDALNLSDYEMINEYDVTKNYRVTEKNSNVTFDVTFYFYGGIISGWSIKTENESFENYIHRLVL